MAVKLLMAVYGWIFCLCQVEPGCQADSGPRRQHGDGVGQGRPTQGGVRGVL